MVGVEGPGKRQIFTFHKRNTSDGWLNMRQTAPLSALISNEAGLHVDPKGPLII